MTLDSQYLADLHTETLHDERAACIYLSGPDAPCSESVKEFHADKADQFSDEIDRRADTR